MVRVQFDSRLVEEAVLQRIESAGAARHRELRRERDTVYELRDAEVRERAFAALHERWFTRLGLGTPVFAALREQGLDRANVSGIFVLRAVSAKDEGADLHASSPAPRLVVRLRPETLAGGETVLSFLRPELLHVADMLDPSFAYERSAPESGEPPIDELRKARYRVLWDTTVDGRLFQKGLLSPGAVARRRSEFSLLFPESERRFGDLLHGPRPSHAELWKEAVRS